MGRRRQRLALVGALAVSLMGTTACGFTPLYATPGVSPGLAAIDVEAPEGRTAYLLRERLDDALARNRSMPAAFRLDFTYVERRDPRGLGVDNAASRYELNLTVDYTLTRVASGEVVKAGQQHVLITYDAVPAPYAGIAAQQDSQERAAAEAARRIRIDLAEYFAKIAS
jgi:LPS-assembly lipoprotein